MKKALITGITGQDGAYLAEDSWALGNTPDEACSNPSFRNLDDFCWLDDKIIRKKFISMRK